MNGCLLGGRPSSDDGYLESMASAIFRMGFSREIVEKKWPRFREAFAGFSVEKVSGFGAADVKRLLADRGIVRNQEKIEAVIDNAGVLRAVGKEFGSFGRYAARTLKAGGEEALLADLGKRFVRLGSKTSLVFLRMSGHEMPETMKKDAAFARRRKGGRNHGKA
jgi:3-methyladenine DNA glycosylase Tag